MMFKESPVLLIIFNRPNYTKVVFEALRRAKPSKLYVFADGPRKGNESDINNCKKSREIVQSLDWKCDVKYRFLDENLGCGWGPASAITWAFKEEDRLIILEDDCVPSLPFFNYCNYLLEKFLNDTRIWLISGRNDNTDSKFFKNVDYMFSHYGHSWGWATWKRVWIHFDIEMKSYPDFLKYGGFTNSFFSEREGKLYNQVYERIYKDKTLSSHIWDFQFGYSIISNGGLCIVPAKNLIENIGIEGTHSKGKNKYCNLKSHEDFAIINEPKFVLANRKFDAYHFKNHIYKNLKKRNIIDRIINKILKVIEY
ncbi:MAG TPA: hypothetical protein P5332_11440 [Ignavibacteriales bacterium]|nr:hypothetical protein [Ignavibacteriales bacterium]